MKLPNFRKLWKSDYPKEFQDLVEQLSVSVNNGLEVLYEMGNKKVSLRDNIFCTVKEIEVTVDANGRPTTTTSASLDQQGSIEGVQVLSVTNLTTTSAYTQSGVQVFYTPQNNGISIDNIKGLITGSKYRIKLVIYQF